MPATERAAVSVLTHRARLGYRQMAVSKRHSTSSEVDKSFDGQANSQHLLRLKADYHAHYNLPRIPILRQTNRNHSPPPAYFFKIQFNIILQLYA